MTMSRGTALTFRAVMRKSRCSYQFVKDLVVCRPTDSCMKPAGIRPLTVSSSDESWTHVATRPHPPRRTTLPSCRAVHLFRCADQTGVVAAIAESIKRVGGNMLTCDLFVDMEDSRFPVFMARSTFTYNHTEWSREDLESHFNPLHQSFNALESQLYVPVLEAEKPKVGILFSNMHHCVTELLHRYESKELACIITMAVSNHPLDPNGYLCDLFERHNIRFHYIPSCTDNRREDEILDAVADTDVLVLARYMQILSPRFLNVYDKDIINIHHGLLPSFKGANPHKQAHSKGVKIIGATAHFVSEDLDDGPIIEQLTERVSHRDSLANIRDSTRALERQCLFNAVSYYLERKVMRYSHGRVAILN